MPRQIYIGTAGWSIPRASAEHFPDEGTHLQRYGLRLKSAEINSSFYRPHAATTYARWAASVPADFRFAVKLPRAITHEMKLRCDRAQIVRLLDETSGLGDKRGPLLVQLPPSLAFEEPVAAPFFDLLRSLYDGPLVCEPRHPTWFPTSVDTLLDRYHVARVAADPPPVTGADQPNGWPGLAYFRLHGSPRKYWSAYDPTYLTTLAAAIRRTPGAVDVWCVFDNTASGAAIVNACDLQAMLAGCTPLLDVAPLGA